jgi:hypothetical protein
MLDVAVNFTNIKNNLNMLLASDFTSTIFGDTTLSITTLSITTFSITTFSIMTLSITTLSLTTLSITTFSIIVNKMQQSAKKISGVMNLVTPLFNKPTSSMYLFSMANPQSITKKKS